MPEYNLKSVLNKVGNKTLNFVLLKGAKDNHVLLTPKVASPKQIEGLEKEIGEAKKIAKGLCFYEKGALVFATKASPAPNWETLITKIFKENQSSTFLPVTLRQLGENESDEVEEVETDEDRETEQPTPNNQGESAPQTNGEPNVDPAEVARLQAALQKITPVIKARVVAYPSRKDEILRPVAAFQQQLKDGQLAEAKTTLTNLANVLKELGGGESGGGVQNGGSDAEFLQQWTAAKEAWLSANETVDGQIEQLIAALKASDDEELREISSYGLNALTGNYKVPVQVSIQNVDSATAETRPAFAAKARKAVSDFLQHLNSDEQIEACDENPFQVTVRIRPTLGGALTQLNNALAAV